jgi:hypothetical protein
LRIASPQATVSATSRDPRGRTAEKRWWLEAVLTANSHRQGQNLQEQELGPGGDKHWLRGRPRQVLGIRDRLQKLASGEKTKASPTLAWFKNPKNLKENRIIINQRLKKNKNQL